MANDYMVLGKLEKAILRKYITKTKRLKLANNLRNKFIMATMGIAMGAAITVFTSDHTAIPVVMAATTNGVVTTTSNSVNLGPIVAYIHYITTIIRVIAAAMFGLVLTYMGLNQVTSIDGNAAVATKKYLHGALWGLVLVFAGAQLASIFVSHIPVV